MASDPEAECRHRACPLMPGRVRAWRLMQVEQHPSWVLELDVREDSDQRQRRSGSLAAISAATAAWLGWTYRCKVASRL